MFSSLYNFIARRSNSEKQLLTRIRKGSESAYKTFYDMNVRSTNYMAYGFTNQKLGAEDLGFETLKEIWRNHASIDVDKPAKVLIAETMITVYLRNMRAMNN
ncbi:hypothetical protein [Dinghuibacter silviterrae]|uniref:Uncharacterized protein n=1 Tax=Dinghuibacter silviterrae TaxID=1539049 RepID=A0A4R8DTT9_9BACT|nr:hypothetical protein [Dinghuibacter silviterrae]TDX01338.1 hypothetical protein EDB95_2371 [Dinghuibacter silviterrae]